MTYLRRFWFFAYLVILFGCTESSDQNYSETPQETSAAEVQQEVLPSSDPAASSPPPGYLPNIVFILVDDMGWEDAGYNGSEIATPNLDQLAIDGIRLDQNYVYPVCSPTRAALLTGQSPFKYGIDGPISDDAGLPLDVRTMPEYFRSLGYETHMIGKWHLGIGDRSYFPISRGFDSHYGFLGGWIDYNTHVYSGGLDWQRDGESLREDGHATELLTAEALRLVDLKSSAAAPFFLYLSYNAPHTPLQGGHPPSGLNDSVTPEARNIYAELVTGMDKGVGQILHALELEDLMEDTIVVFSSDNGGALSSGADNGDLRGGKGGAFEGGIRVPGLVWWKGRIEGGRVVDQPIAVHDWLPTLIEATGKDPTMIADAYGQSMWPALVDGTRIDREPTTIGVQGSIAAIDWPWKLVDHTTRGPDGVRSVSLFNIQDDPTESIDLAQEYPEKFAELNTLITQLPKAESLRSSGPPPDDQFRNEDGSWNFNFRMEETKPPWAD